MIRKYAEAVVRFRWFVLAITLLATFGLASRIKDLRLDNDPDLWSPQNHEFIKTTHTLEKLFGGRTFTVVGIVPKHGDIYTPEILNKIRNIQKAVEEIPGAIKHNVLSLAAKRVKDIQGTPDGMVVRDIMERIPQTPAEIEAMRQAIARNPIYVNALVSPDGKAAAVVADFRMGPNSTYTPLYERILAIADHERSPDVDILIGGQPAESANFEYAMQKMPMFFGIAFLIIMMVQWFAFRSFQGMLLPMATAILSVMWGLGCLALAGIHLDALNTTTPILIMAVATGHAVQILKRYYEELEGLGGNATGKAQLRQANQRAVVQSLANVGPVMLTAGLIAAIAFFSMQASEVMMIRHFGFFAGVGVLSTIVIEFSFIPALRAMLPAKRRVHRDADIVDKFLARIGALLTNPAKSRAILVVSLILIAGIAAGTTRLRVDNSIKQYSANTNPIRRDSIVLNDKFGGTDSIFFLIAGDERDSMKDPKVLGAMAKLQAFLDQQPNVGKTQSLADLIRRMNQAMHGDDKAFDVVPTDGNLISQYLLLYSMSGQPEDFDNVVDNDYKNAVVWAYLKTDSTAYASQLWKKCQELIAREFPANIHVRIGGGLPQTVAINDSLVDTKVRSIFQIALVVLVLAGLVFGSLVGALLVVAPLLAIVFVNFGLMGWLGLSLDMGSATIAAMVVGIGADYEIYMLYRLREEFARTGNLDRSLRNSLMTSGKAVLFVALSIAGGYASLLISDFRFYPRLATTMIGTMITSALLSLLLLRVVISLIKPKFIMRKHAGNGLSLQPEPAEPVHRV
jgi:predicted RND superfamily exporter protein